MRYLIVITLVFCLSSCKKVPNTPNNPQAASFQFSDIRPVLQKVIMDYYHQNDSWPSSSDELVIFCQENSDKYPGNAYQICQTLKLRLLQDGNLHVESNIDSQEFTPALKILAKRIDTNNVKNLTWHVSMILSSSGRLIEESEIDPSILTDPNKVFRPIAEPISVKTVYK